MRPLPLFAWQNLGSGVPFHHEDSLHAERLVRRASERVAAVGKAIVDLDLVVLVAAGDVRAAGAADELDVGSIESPTAIGDDCRQLDVVRP